MLSKLRALGTPKQPSERQETTPTNSVYTPHITKNMTFQEWLGILGLRTNPFTFEILPDVMVGYTRQGRELIDSIRAGSKMVLLLGPTGSGKTTLLKWLAASLQGEKTVIFLPKPPNNPEDFIGIFNSYFQYGLLRKKKADNLYTLPAFIQAAPIKKDIVLICDEIHEAPDEVLMWLRALSDNVENMSIVMAGLPRFERDLGERLETLRKRISVKINVLSLTKEETYQLIDRRLGYAGGGSIFPTDLLEYIYDKSAGFPREVLRICDEVLRKAYDKGSTSLTKEIVVEETTATEPIVSSAVPNKQRLILEALVNPITAAALAEKFTQHYKSKQHALRAINNLLHRLMTRGYIEREHYEKTYIYKLSTKARTAFVTK